ncbi:MAG TPA: MOSC domain-containing protein [Drouetiella sp.]
MNAKILTICVSRKKLVQYNGRTVSTGIFKTPVAGKIPLSKVNLAGDEQADLTVHGGPDKAVYAYPIEHYHWWQEQMPDVEFPHGKFGENLTTEGLLESEVCIGDEFQVGSAIIKVSQPRLPCYKLGIKFGRLDVIKTFQQSSRCGIYFSVVQEGNVAAGDEIKLLRRDEYNVNLQEVARLFSGKHDIDPEFVYNALESNLAEQMKMFIRGSFV